MLTYCYIAVYTEPVSLERRVKSMLSPREEKRSQNKRQSLFLSVSFTGFNSRSTVWEHHEETHSAPQDIFKSETNSWNEQIAFPWHYLQRSNTQLLPVKRLVCQAGHCLDQPQVSLCPSWLCLIRTLWLVQGLEQGHLSEARRRN